MSERAVAAQESHKATGCTDCVQPVFVWILKCSGEPCSPLRVRCTRLHALRAKLNAHFMLYQNILYKHKYSSSGRPMNAPTVYTNSYNTTLGHKCFLHYKLSTRIGNGGSPCGRPMNAPTVYTNSYNTTLGHKCFLTLQTIYTNWERRLAVRASNVCSVVT